MQVLIMDNIPDALRGKITLWMFEVKSGVYVSDVNARLRDFIWNTVKDNIGSGSAVFIWSTNKMEFGFDIDSIGNSQRILDEIDGVKLLMHRAD